MNLRILFAALLVVAAGTPVFAAKAMYAGTDWSDVIAKVNCKDAKQLADGQWQLSADVSIGGSVRADPVVSGASADALKKRCGTSLQSSMSSPH